MSTDFNIVNGVLRKYDGTDTVVNIPDGVTKIGNYAFSENNNITEVRMPDTVTSVGEHAFYHCVKLKTVNFSKNLERIEDFAFEKCKALTEAILPETLLYIGYSAFVGCVKLKAFSCASEKLQLSKNSFESYDGPSCKLLYNKNGMLILEDVLVNYIGNAENIEIPYGVKRIASNTFATYRFGEVNRIKSVILPETVTHVDENAFATCSKLKSYSAPAGITYGENAFNGCKGLADKTGFVIVDSIAFDYFGKDETVTVPDGVEVLDSGLFNAVFGCNAGNKNITTVHLPSTLKRIGAGVFLNSPVGSVEIPHGVTEIGDGAFECCANLKEISIPDSVEKLGADLFKGCRAMADENGFVIKCNTLYEYYGSERNIVIPEGIEVIADNVFSDAAIKSIRLPSTLKKLGSAFKDCNMLAEVIVPEGVEEICSNTFSGCVRLSRVVLPSTIKQIGDSAFEGCEALKEIDLPRGVQYIGSHAFENCLGLENVSLPNNISALESQTFKCCSQLKTVKLPDELKVIGPDVFGGCSNLKSIEIPASVSEIQYSAFQHCTSLKKVEMSDASEVTVDGNAFDGCKSLADENGFAIIGGILRFYSGEGGKITVPEGVTQIASNAFREGHDYKSRNWKDYRKEGSLLSVSLPKSLKKIHDHAFAGCIGLNGISLPENLETIGKFAFHGCMQLTGIEIPASVTEIGKNAFTSCKNLTGITVDAQNQYFSDKDGILFNKDATELIFCPSGKKLTEYIVSNHVTAIATHAFIDCENLKKVVIPESVSVIGDEIFMCKNWAHRSKIELTDIEVSPKAGSKKVGSDIFDFRFDNKALVYPKLPVTFIKESATQVLLGMGYCLHPEKYEGEYADIYKKYVTSHEKTIKNKAKQLKLTGVEAYYSAQGCVNADAKATFKPNVSAKKLSELAKVELLEETVQKGSIDDLRLVLKTYKNFEMMSRALAIAARYRGLEFVKELVDAGATFDYESTPALQRKYQMNQDTAGGMYSTEYYLMLVPEKLGSKLNQWGGSKYAYTPLCGVPAMNIPDELEESVLSIEERFEITKFCSENKKLKISLGEMLFWALINGDLEFTDLLIEYGVDLNTTTPDFYYNPWYEYSLTHMDVITTTQRNIYSDMFINLMAQLTTNKLLPVLERLNKLTTSVGKTFIVRQKLYDVLKWNDQSLRFALENLDISKINQTKALELAVDNSFIASLEFMAQSGWLSTTAKREKLIEFARTNNKIEALTWLLDFKNRTVDVLAEAAKEEAKLMRELNEDPNSVSALKKVWGYKKLDNGTLIITSYKGDAIDVEVPAVIGKAAVTVIGEDAFSAADWNGRIKNKKERKRIKSIVIPEGVIEIQRTAFWDLDELEKLILPSTLKKIGTAIAGDCEKLKEVNMPDGVKLVGDGVLFWRCNKLHDKNGCIIINNCLYTHTEHDGWSHDFGDKSDIGNITIPENVTEIAAHVFTEGRMSSVTLPDGLKVIGKEAFVKCSLLEEVTIPGSVSTIKPKAFSSCASLKTIKLASGVAAIGDRAFERCASLRDVYIPKSVKKLGKEIFGPYDNNASFWDKVIGIYVHTHKDSPAVEYMKQYNDVTVVFDYDE